jgi:hypothetical protein
MWLLYLESELLYDWRLTANQFVLATSPLRPTTSTFFFQLNPCGHSLYVTSSLTRGWVCQLLLAFASTVNLGSESHGTHDHILLSQIRDSLNLEYQISVFISPGIGFPFGRKATVEVFEPASTRGLTNSVLLITSRHGPHRKHRSIVPVPSLRSCLLGFPLLLYPIVAVETCLFAKPLLTTAIV